MLAHCHPFMVDCFKRLMLSVTPVIFPVVTNQKCVVNAKT